MEYTEAKEKFIQAWGTLGSDWGINKAMAQIHALLLISPQVLSTEEIMDELKISRGNANTNIRNLIDWGIVFKVNKIGERKEYFSAKKDIWELARAVARERRKREIAPLISVLSEIKDVEKSDSAEYEEFSKVTGEIYDFSTKMDGLLEKFSRSDLNWFLKLMMKA